MTIRRTIGRLAVGSVAATAILATTFAPTAFAAEPNVAVTGGTLAITAAPTASDFTAVTLDGTAKTTTTNLSTFEVNDARGTGAGWNVTVQATRFAEHNGTAYVASGKTLPTSSLTLAAPTVLADGTTSAAPVITAGPYTIDAGGAVKIASAAVDAGMGKYDFSQAAATLSIPTSAYAKNYRSTVTVTVATGP